MRCRRPVRLLPHALPPRLLHGTRRPLPNSTSRRAAAALTRLEAHALGAPPSIPEPSPSPYLHPHPRPETKPIPSPYLHPHPRPETKPSSPTLTLTLTLSPALTPTRTRCVAGQSVEGGATDSPLTLFVPSHAPQQATASAAGGSGGGGGGGFLRRWLSRLGR